MKQINGTHLYLVSMQNRNAAFAACFTLIDAKNVRLKFAYTRYVIKIHLVEVMFDVF